ncbi:UDP-3-O-acyl-N-acetylglucosamine deacetylase [Curvivirga aplysinae]|uniref:UDP-3-O-acyl-N-acetylglucosamine deacetylase n=1 Tax=Curvivirga aplysinae TaxID=2529852 RepID=UPI001F43589A|nr:UDP-3-O-acyl-N-acetylglucosamine deacetylase [Curvivirga aplysinae]
MLDGMNTTNNSEAGFGNRKSTLRLNQTTLKNTIHCNGVGLHSGADITLTMKPAAANSGVTFIRTDVEEGKGEIKARYDLVSDTRLCTKITNEYDVSIGTVEHLMAAVAGCGLDNVDIELDGPEVPVMDGSSEPFVFLIECAGLLDQHTARQVVVVKKEVSVKIGDSVASLKPADDYTISLAIDFENKAIGKQEKYISVSAASFKNDISRARTFGSVQDVEMLRQMGLARGASLDNAVGLDGDRVMNEEGLRFDDEFVRHKILDCIGDLSLAGATLMGQFIGYKGGHALNNALLRELFADESNWELVNAAEFTPAPALLQAAD